MLLKFQFGDVKYNGPWKYKTKRGWLPVLLFKMMIEGKLFPRVSAIGDLMSLIFNQNKSLDTLMLVLFWLMFILII